MRRVWLLLCASVVSAHVQITVVDEQLAPVPDAQVRATCGGKPVWLVTPVAGIVTLPCSGTVQLTAPGFEAATLRVFENTTVRLRPATLMTSIEVVVRSASSEGRSVTGNAVAIDRTGARTVLDAIDRLVPGAFVTRRGVMGYGIATNGTGGITIRGVGGQPNTGVLVVVDGRPDMQGLMGHPLPDFYSLADAESVTVTQGPASVLYGSNAMGGAVEIKPKRPVQPGETRLTTSFGSFYTGQHRLSHGVRQGQVFYNFTAGLDHTTGDRTSSDFRNKDASVAAGYDFSEHWKTSLQGRYGFFHVEDPGPVTAPLSNMYARVGRGGFSWNLDNAFARTLGYTRVYGSWGRHFINDGFRSTDETLGFRTQQTFAATQNVSIDFGGDYNRFGGLARNLRQRLNYGEHTLRDGGVFTRATWTHDRLQLNTGFRYHMHSLYGGVAVPEAGARVHITPKYSISAAVSRGFRNPTIRELYLFPAPNPLLTPESLWNSQVTLHARPHAAVNASATLYYADLRDSIVTLGRFPNLQLANTGSARNRGIETTVRWRIVRSLELNTGYAYLRSTNLAPLIPAHRWTYALNWNRARWSVDLNATVAGRRYTDLRRVAQLGRYSTATTRVSYTLRRGLHLFTLIDNVLNERYEILPGYPMPGANAAGGITLAF